MSACHVSLGSSASKRISEERGRFCGWGTTRPSRRKIRQIVETEGACSLCRARWWAIVCAPQSPPRACNWDWSAVPWSVAPGPHSRPRDSGPRACRSNCDARHGLLPALRPSDLRPDAPRPGTAPLPQEISLRWVSPMSRHRCRLSTETGHHQPLRTRSRSRAGFRRLWRCKGENGTIPSYRLHFGH